MPQHSFRAEISEDYINQYRVVWHGFYGRWKPAEPEAEGEGEGEGEEKEGQ